MINEVYVKNNSIVIVIVWFIYSATRVYIQVTATRGTGTYTKSWKRAF